MHEQNHTQRRARRRCWQDNDEADYLCDRDIRASHGGGNRGELLRLGAPPNTAPLSLSADRFAHMNPNRHRAVELRRRALTDQIAGLEAQVAAGDDRVHVADRLVHTRAELVSLGTAGVYRGSNASHP